MTNVNDPAFPLHPGARHPAARANSTPSGITKREYFTGQALASMGDIDDTPENIAKTAIEIADEVIKLLNS
jgi:hypothetical protein